MKISAKTNANPEAGTIEVEVDIPSTLSELEMKFGADVVANAAIDSLVITVQALIRRMMTPKTNKEGKVTAAGSNAEVIQAAVSAWKPDVRTVVRQSALEKATNSLATMSADDRKALLAKLKELG